MDLVDGLFGIYPLMVYPCMLRDHGGLLHVEPSPHGARGEAADAPKSMYVSLLLVGAQLFYWDARFASKNIPTGIQISVYCLF